MIYIGDYFALALVGVVFLFFLDTKTSLRYMSTPSKLFIVNLIMTAATALIDLLTVYMLGKDFPLWLNMVANSAFFISGTVTTTFIALYMFMRILEHTHEKHCMRRAYIGLTVLLVGYLAVVAANIRTGWLFYFDESGNYCRGPLNGLAYIIATLQLGMVIICFLRNKKNRRKHRVAHSSDDLSGNSALRNHKHSCSGSSDELLCPCGC